MVNVGQAAIVPASYTLSELVAIETRILENGDQLSGWTSVGTNLYTNRVTVGFSDSASLIRGLALMESIGVPPAALDPQIRAPFHLAYSV
jgi:hypothetical protein